MSLENVLHVAFGFISIPDGIKTNSVFLPPRYLSRPGQRQVLGSENMSTINIPILAL
uniref:Uncharacterized protein n=1 Tax=Lepeophtheirus salmonis TaxID=72036 RepID=A0A0K2UUG3_LEPSM